MKVTLFTTMLRMTRVDAKAIVLRLIGSTKRIEDFCECMCTQTRSLDCARIAIHAQLPVRADNLQRR